MCECPVLAGTGWRDLPALLAMKEVAALMKLSFMVRKSAGCWTILSFSNIGQGQRSGGRGIANE